MGRFARKFEPFYREIREDIYAFCKALAFEPTHQQAAVLDMVMAATHGGGSRRIAVKSGQGPGKTAISTIVGFWRTIRWPGALTVVSAPTMRQVRDVWLTEADRRLEDANPLLQKFIRVTKTRVIFGGNDKWGVRTVTATKAENAQGLHHPNLTVILEEASGIPRALVDQFKGTMTNKDSLLMMIGNPNTRDSAFFDCFNSMRHRWNTLTLNSEESPIVDPKNIRELEEEFGADSDVYRVRVLGEFPYADPNCVLSSEDLEKCTDRKYLYSAALVGRGKDGKPAKQFGMDFARFGGDENTIYRRYGQAIVEWGRWPHTDPNDVVDHAFRMQAMNKWRDEDTYYVGDAGGMGQGVMGNFHRAGKNIFEFHNGGKAHDRQYANLITEAWFQFARKVRAHATAPVYIPKDNRLIQQLCSRHYYTNKKGQLILETKDEYMKRGHDSPDRADGLVLCYYDNVIAQAQIASRGRGREMRQSVRRG